MEQKVLKKYKVATLRDIDDLYTYHSEDDLDIGQIIAVPLRNRETLAVIVEKDSEFEDVTKKISAILPYSITEEYVKFARFVAYYTLTKLGSVFKLILPFSVDSILSPEKGVRSIQSEYNAEIELNTEQQAALEHMKKFKGIFKTILLHGVTGSGKTSVYLQYAYDISKDFEDVQILILVPEIALSTELAKNASAILGMDVYIWHNSITPSKKLGIWKKALNGESIVVVGARSALFIPFSNLRLIIVDEEHDGSYKQNESVIYHGRDMAVYLGYTLNIPVVLSSATPSIESYHNAISGKYEYVKLSARYHANAKLPAVILDDLRKNSSKGILSERSIFEINECLKLNKQALVFVNRRGYNPKVLCKSCGWKVECPGCSTWLCFHHETTEFVCHYCGFKMQASNKCQECGKQSLIGIGAGIEKVYDECLSRFSGARIMQLSSDTINTPNKISKAMEMIKNREVDIILGTQIIAKGHNFNDLNLVIITCVDAMMYGEDFRAIEKTYQLVSQVAGRAGRIGDGESKVIIQTYSPDEDVMRILENYDLEGLYTSELKNRERFLMPPFGKLASLTISSFSEECALKFAKHITLTLPKMPGLKIIGPIQPVIYKLKSRFRQRIILISASDLQSYLRQNLHRLKIPNDVKLSVDIDPYDFY